VHHIYENFSILGAVSCGSVLLKGFFNSILLFLLISKIAQETKM
jgi:hypothetical protein